MESTNELVTAAEARAEGLSLDGEIGRAHV